MSTELTAVDIAESQLGNVTQELTGRRYKVKLIEADKLGSSGYYPAAVLASDGPKVFTKGTPMFINHQTPDEKSYRPFGNIHDYAGELAEDAYFDRDGLYAEVEVFEDFAPKIKARKDKIGISIRATGVASDQEMNGKIVPVFKQITEARSADFVMRAGAGGKIVSILESANEENTDTETEIGETMDQAQIDALVEGIAGKFESRFAGIEESLTALKPVEVTKTAEESATVDPDAKALEIAEALAGSTLDADGRKRVLALHKANGEDIAKLIEAEEAYVTTHRTVADDSKGIEESADKTVEAEESAKKFTVPTISAWK